MDQSPSAQYMFPLTLRSTIIINYSIVSTMENVILVGDYNMPDICWSSLTGTSTFSNSFCDFVFEMSLSQLVMEATHIKGNILDLVLTNVKFHM